MATPPPLDPAEEIDTRSEREAKGKQEGSRIFLNGILNSGATQKTINAIPKESPVIRYHNFFLSFCTSVLPKALLTDPISKM